MKKIISLKSTSPLTPEVKHTSSFFNRLPTELFPKIKSYLDGRSTDSLGSTNKENRSLFTSRSLKILYLLQRDTINPEKNLCHKLMSLGVSVSYARCFAKKTFKRDEIEERALLKSYQEERKKIREKTHRSAESSTLENLYLAYTNPTQTNEMKKHISKHLNKKYSDNVPENPYICQNLLLLHSIGALTLSESAHKALLRKAQLKPSIKNLYLCLELCKNDRKTYIPIMEKALLCQPKESQSKIIASRVNLIIIFCMNFIEFFNTAIQSQTPFIKTHLNSKRKDDILLKWIEEQPLSITVVFKAHPNKKLHSMILAPSSEKLLSALKETCLTNLSLCFLEPFTSAVTRHKQMDKVFESQFLTKIKVAEESPHREYYRNLAQRNLTQIRPTQTSK